MPDPREPHASAAAGSRTGRHGLGPHVVGRRVVVRHRLPDGRATDTLGVCTTFAEDHLELDADAGAVRIALADVVTGKPVPPRPSVRARVPAVQIERRAFAGWPEVRREPVGDWVVRSAPPMGGRLLKRANSALAFEDPGLPLAEASARVLEAYRRLERDPLAQVERDGEIEAALTGLGWRPRGIGDSVAQVGSLAQVARRLPAPPEDAEAVEGTARVEVSVADAASGGAALDGDWLCVHSVAVEPAYRRRGLARLVLAELLDWGASRGVTTVWLHVEVDNQPALALYDSLGFRTHHGCRYLTHD